MNQKNVGDSVRAGCGDKPHVRFGRGGLVLLSNQDPAFYLTSEPGKAWHRAKGGRWRSFFDRGGEAVRCVSPHRYLRQSTLKLESRMLRKRARPVRRGEVGKGSSLDTTWGTKGYRQVGELMIPRRPPTLLFSSEKH
jgi:hypothetical protein